MENANTTSKVAKAALRLKNFGPGILMATAAVGGSHIVSATQAGALYGWKLLLLVVLVNLFKYPFMRIGADYTLTTGKSLVQGYADLKKWNVAFFYILMIFSTICNTAAVAMLSGTLIQFVLPQISTTAWTMIILGISWALVVFGGYKILDKFSKIVMTFLTLFTVAVVIVSLGHSHEFAEGFVEKSPWNFASLPFLISLMGWMPAPIEVSVLSSLWSVAKNEDNKAPVPKKDGLLDFDVSYLVTAVLAVAFLAMGALIQYGTGDAIMGASAAYIKQFVGMYTSTFGDWSGVIIAIVAFLCIFGTTVTVVDGYSRGESESHDVLFGKERSPFRLKLWITSSVVFGGLIVFFFADNIATLMKIAMILSFITAPFFAYLNYKVALNTKEMQLSKPMHVLSIAGLVFLTGFAGLFIYAMATGNAGL